MGIAGHVTRITKKITAHEAPVDKPGSKEDVCRSWEEALRLDLHKYGRMYEEWLRTGTGGRPL